MKARVGNNGHDVFEVRQDAMDVTSRSRPDIAWRHTDAAGHLHRWHVRKAAPAVTMQAPGQAPVQLEVGELVPADAYDPSARYEVPTLVWVQDGLEYWDGDDEPHAVGHRECRQCAAHVQPGYRADDTTQLVPGLRSCYINGVPVDHEEFERRLAATIAEAK